MKLCEILFEDYIELSACLKTKDVSGIARNPELCLINSKAFGYPPLFYSIYDGEILIGLFHGNQLKSKVVSFPHFSYGGLQISYDSNIKSQEIFNLLKEKFPKLEIRSFESLTSSVSTDKVSSWIELESDISKQFDSFTSNVRRKIRKAEKEGISVVRRSVTTDNGLTTNTFAELDSNKLLKDFYMVYRKNMRRLGSPQLHFSFFETVLRNYERGNSGIFVSYIDGQPIGGGICLGFNGFYENCWFATDHRYNKLYTPYLLHWKMMEHAINNKLDIYSFGRSTNGSGTHRFKKQWGSFDKQLFWNFSLPKKVNIRKMRLASEVWKRLPYLITDWLGPVIAGRVY